MLKRPDAVFFDWDGTLVDSFAFLLEAHNHVRAIFSLESFTAIAFGQWFGMPREQLYETLYGRHSAEAKAHFERFVFQHHLKSLKPLPGADGLVRTIFNMKIISGVVSNKKGSFIRAEIDSFSWTPLLNAIVGAGEASNDKPAADPLLLAISLAKPDLKPSNVWYVGDSETDAKCALNAGSVTVLIDHGTNLSGWSHNYNPALIVKSCNELNDYLLQYH